MSDQLTVPVVPLTVIKKEEEPETLFLNSMQPENEQVYKVKWNDTADDIAKYEMHERYCTFK